MKQIFNTPCKATQNRFNVLQRNANKYSSDMEKIDQILESLYDRVIEPMEAKEQLLDLFAVSNSALIEGCKTVVNGYEDDGMENMQNRDEVFYEWCKRALEHCA